MSTQHTPGPWVAFADHPEGAIPVRADGLLVAVCRYSQNPRIGKENAEANAHLIAAAPELLEALKDVMDRLVDKHEQDESAVAAHAAITKATGEGKHE